MYSDLSINTLILARNTRAKPHAVLSRINVDLKNIMPDSDRSSLQDKVITAVDTLCDVIKDDMKWSLDLTAQIKQVQSSLINADYKNNSTMWKLSISIRSLIFSLMCYKKKVERKVVSAAAQPDRIDQKVHVAFAEKRKLNYHNQIRRLGIPTSIMC